MLQVYRSRTNFEKRKEMSTGKQIKHLIATDFMGIGKKIKDFRKPRNKRDKRSK